MSKVMLRWAVIFFVVLTIGVVVLSVPIFAIVEPDTPPQVSAVEIFEDLLEDGDVGVLVDYYLDYGATPNETVTEAYLVVFVDTDGTTQLKSVAPYVFVNSGYGRGLAWVYFSADEVTSYSINQSYEEDYSVWLIGNPTLSWTPETPKTVTGVNDWQTAGDTAVLLALRVLYYADQLELAWPLDMIETTALGSRLTSVGESYFENVIANLRTMAPSAFSVSEIVPAIEDIDYETSFGATATGAIITGSPVTISEGGVTITATGIGDFIIELDKGTVGTIEDATGTINGSPVALVAGTNTITVTGAGTLLVDVGLQDTTTAQDDIVAGTGFDLTTIATIFGMSRWFFSGMVWLIMSVLISAAAYRVTPNSYGSVGASKIILVIFDICIIGGVLLGLLKPVVAVGMFLAFGAFTGYILFFRGAHF